MLPNPRVRRNSSYAGIIIIIELSWKPYSSCQITLIRFPEDNFLPPPAPPPPKNDATRDAFPVSSSSTEGEENLLILLQQHCYI